MKELSEMVISRANETNTPITNLQLQKVMYFLLLFMINGAENKYRDRAERIFREGELQAWPYGPVDKPTYEKYKHFKDKPINDEINNDIDIDNTLEEWIDELLKINVFNLVRLSHEHEFWKVNENKIKFGMRPKYEFDNLIGLV